MTEPTPGSAPASLSLPDAPNLDWLRKQAKRRLGELRKVTPSAKLADAQFAHHGHLPAVDLLLRRGLDANTREKGDNTYAMHWAAAAGHLDIVRRLADAGGDVVGLGDDHELQVIGWATCWDDGDDEPHRAVAEFLVSRGARHHIYSAIALDLQDEVRRIASADPSALTRPMSHNEDYQLPLHFAVRKNRPEMVALLMELGADPLAPDGSGYPAAAYATTPDTDRRLMEVIRAHSGPVDLFTAVALHDWESAARILREPSVSVAPGGPTGGALHLMAKRNDAGAVRWLLANGARWPHWDAEVTPLHLAVMHGHAEIVRLLLLAAGADPRIPDSRFDSDALGWADHFGREEIMQILKAAVAVECEGAVLPRDTNKQDSQNS